MRRRTSGFAAVVFAAVVVVGLAVGACGPWPEKVDGVVTCSEPRDTLTFTMSPEGDSLYAGYARVVFPPGAFETETEVTIRPYEGLHGFHLDFPDEPDVESPPFDAYFYLDRCNVRSVDDEFRISTTERREVPAMVAEDSVVRREAGQAAAGPRPVAWRRVEAGELDDELKSAGFLPAPPLPIRGGFVVLSN